MVFEALSRPTENRCDALHAHALRGDWTVFEALKISSLHFELGVTVEFLDANVFFSIQGSLTKSSPHEWHLECVILPLIQGGMKFADTIQRHPNLKVTNKYQICFSRSARSCKGMQISWTHARM